MKEIDDCLRRLLKSAATCPSVIPDEPPIGFATRVLASLRAASPADEEPVFTEVLFRRVLACSIAVMLLTVAASYHTLTASAGTEEEIANSAIETSLP